MDITMRSDKAIQPKRSAMCVSIRKSDAKAKECTSRGNNAFQSKK